MSVYCNILRFKIKTVTQMPPSRCPPSTTQPPKAEYDQESHCHLGVRPTRQQ